MKVSEQLVKKSLDIITRHEKLLNKINNISDMLNEAKDKLNTYKLELDNIGEDNIKNKTKLYEILMGYENEISKIKTKSQPYIDELEQLKKESSLLYLKIKELFPNNTDDEIKDILHSDMDEYAKKYNI